MSDIVQTNPKAIPSEFNYSLPSSLPNASSREVRVYPINGNNFSVSTSTQILQFDLPCGQSGDYLDPQTTYVRFKISFNTTGMTAGTDIARLIGSAYSFFNLQTVKCGGTIVEQIPECGVLASMLFNCQLNDADRRGLSNTLGFSYENTAYYPSATTGVQINAVANASPLDGNTFEFSIPLMGILGSNTTKMIPVGSINGLRLELTCDILSNITVQVAGSNALSAYTISDIEFCASYIKLSSEIQSEIDRINGGKFSLRTQSWNMASGTLSASTGVGTNDILVNLRYHSMKSIYMACAPANAPEGKFAGVCPNLQSPSSFLIGGLSWPQRSLDPSNKTSDCFSELQKSYGALFTPIFSGCISKNAYYVGSTAFGLLAAYNTTKTGNNTMTSPNQFYLGIDTEILARKNEVLLSGMDTYSSQLMFRASIGATLAAQSHTLYFFGFFDEVLVFDNTSKTVTYYY